MSVSNVQKGGVRLCTHLATNYFSHAEDQVTTSSSAVNRDSSSECYLRIQ